jgi:hypothetical protein
MDCLAFVVIEISGSRQSIFRDGADLGEFCAAVLRRLATAEQKDSENQGSHGDGPISHLIPPEARILHPWRAGSVAGRAFTLRAMASNLTSNDNLLRIAISSASRLLPRKANRLISFSPSPMTVISHSWVSPMSRSSKTVELKK